MGRRVTLPSLSIKPTTKGEGANEVVDVEVEEATEVTPEKVSC